MAESAFQVKARGCFGGKLSLQMHHHRAEHLVSGSGTAPATKGEGRSFVDGEPVDLHPSGRDAIAWRTLVSVDLR